MPMENLDPHEALQQIWAYNYSDFPAEPLTSALERLTCRFQIRYKCEWVDTSMIASRAGTEACHKQMSIAAHPESTQRMRTAVHPESTQRMRTAVHPESTQRMRTAVHPESTQRMRTAVHPESTQRMRTAVHPESTQRMRTAVHHAVHASLAGQGLSSIDHMALLP